ncbi:MAG: TatD family hydrolase [Rikenellaceae bacterium]
MKYIDTHAHLYDECYDTDRREMVERSRAAGVDKILLADVDIASRRAMLEMAAAYPDTCYAMVGVHPTSINENPAWREEIEAVRGELRADASRFVAVGEIGLDLYWSKEFEAEQREAFTEQIELALEYSLPIAVHVRDAWAPALEVIESFAGRGLRGVLHAFSGDVEIYRRVKACGEFYFAIGGVVTFKNSKLGDVVKEIELDDLLLETDAPYLTPTPHRGKRNESQYIPLIAAHIANIKGVSAQEVADATTRNAQRLFNI